MNFNTSFQQKSNGFFGKIAAAWVLPKIELGLNIDIPYIEVSGSGKYKYEEYFSSQDNDIFTFNNFNNLDSKRKYPLGVSFGAGIPLKKHKLHLNVSWNAKTNNYTRMTIPPLESETEEDFPTVSFVEELKPTINFGFGAEIYIAKKVNAYGSFSTDFSPFASSASIFEAANQTDENINLETNYTHFGFGINVSHKWANFILGSVFSRGNSKIAKPLILPVNSSNHETETSSIFINRWRFLVGIEVLFLDKAMNKHGIDKKIIIQ